MSNPIDIIKPDFNTTSFYPSTCSEFQFHDMKKTEEITAIGRATTEFLKNILNNIKNNNSNENSNHKT